MNNQNEQLNRNGNKRGMNPKSRGNLKPNLNGRPPNILTITSLVKQELLRVPTLAEDGFDGKGKTNAEWIARKAVLLARTGELRALDEILNRTEGKVKDQVELSGANGGPMRYEITVASEKAKELTKDIISGKGTE